MPDDDSAGAGGADGDPGLAPAARVAPDGQPVLLADQDRRRWDAPIRRGLDALARAEALASHAGHLGPTPYRPPSPPATPARRGWRTPTWARIVGLYDALAQIVRRRWCA